VRRQCARAHAGLVEEAVAAGGIRAGWLGARHSEVRILRLVVPRHHLPARVRTARLRVRRHGLLRWRRWRRSCCGGVRGDQKSQGGTHRLLAGRWESASARQRAEVKFNARGEGPNCENRRLKNLVCPHLQINCVVCTPEARTWWCTNPRGEALWAAPRRWPDGRGTPPGLLALGHVDAEADGSRCGGQYAAAASVVG
jgi:hypothetical protein